MTKKLNSVVHVTTASRQAKCVIADDMADIELTTIFENLGNDIKGIIWGEGVWHKGEVMSTQAMIEAYEAGKNV